MARWFRPLDENPTIGFIAKRYPRIIISARAADKMDSLVACCTIEISWYATARKSDNDYYIDDVFVPPQVCSVGSTDFFEADLYSAFMGSDGKLSPENLQMISDLHVWGHSHHNMQAYPSKTDEDQTEAFIEKIPGFFIRLICNKRGDMDSALYVFDSDLIFHQPQLIIQKSKKGQLHPYDKWAISEIGQKVTRTTYPMNNFSDEEYEEWMQLGRTSYAPKPINHTPANDGDTVGG